MKMIKTLMENDAKAGTVSWMGIRPGKKKPLQSCSVVQVNPEQGLVGDHYSANSK
ncbi:MAG: MOSC domain-containing protein, partial [Methylococcales bacterium]|nr:MOSC domain-containing protein [Methylococcales bacterium]